MWIFLLARSFFLSTGRQCQALSAMAQVASGNPASKLLGLGHRSIVDAKFQSQIDDLV
jgi:hypothetical protein